MQSNLGIGSISIPRVAPRFYPQWESIEALVGDQRVKYSLKPNKKLTDYVAKVRLQGPHLYHHALVTWVGDLKMHEMRQLDRSEIDVHILIHTKPSHLRPYSFEVQISRPSKPVETGAPPEQASGAIVPIVQPPPQTPERLLNFVCFNSAWDLAAAIEKGLGEVPVIKDICDRMIRRFHKERATREGIIQEMVALLAAVNEEERLSIVNKFVNAIDENWLEQQYILEGLTASLRLFQRATYKPLVDVRKFDETAQEWDIDNPLHTLKPSELIKIAYLLIRRIPEIPDAQAQLVDTKPPSIWDLEALIATLEVMEMIKVTGVERKKYHEPFYDTLDTYDLVPNLKQAFLAAYGKQILVHIHDNETKLHAAFRHIGHFIGCLVHLAEAYEQKSVAPLKDAAISIRKTFKFQQLKADWYEALCAIDYAMMQNGSRYLRGLKNLIEQAQHKNADANQVIDDLHTSNPFFVMGLVRSLQQVLEHFSSTDVEACQIAIQILKQIGVDNIVGRPGVFTVHMGAYRTIRRFTKRIIPDLVNQGAIDRDKSYSEQLRNEVCNVLKNFAEQHPLLALRQEAKTALDSILNDIHINKKESQLFALKPFKPQPHSTVFFREAVAKVAPWAEGLKKEYESLCLDEQLQNHKPFYIDIKVERGAEEIQMEQAIEDFLKSDNKVMLVTGSAGTGKSFSIKHFAEKTWETGALHGFIPVVINLAAFTDPKQAVLETLKKRGIEGSIAKLQSGDYVKILFLLDSVDENNLKFGVNLYRLNDLPIWTGSKTIFTSRPDELRDGNLHSFYPDDTTDKNFIRINALPFNRTYRERFLDQFLDVYQKKGILNLWQTKQYMDYIDSKPDLQSIISVPLFLHLTAETLPQILELRKQEGVPEDSKIVENDLLDAFFCLMVARDQANERRAGNIPKYELKEYLEYALKVAKAISDYADSKGVAWIPTTEALDLHSDLFDDKDEKVIRMRRCCSLILKDEQWGFGHEKFHAYFAALNASSARRTVVRERLVNGKYGFDKFLSGSSVIY